jgi:hypothetical protein
MFAPRDETGAVLLEEILIDEDTTRSNGDGDA